MAKLVVGVVSRLDSCQDCYPVSLGSKYLQPDKQLTFRQAVDAVETCLSAKLQDKDSKGASTVITSLHYADRTEVAELDETISGELLPRPTGTGVDLWAVVPHCILQRCPHMGALSAACSPAVPLQGRDAATSAPAALTGTTTGADATADAAAGDIIRKRLPAASKYAADLPIDGDDPSLGTEAATVVASDTLVTFAHGGHSTWTVGKEVQAMVHDPNHERRRPAKCRVTGINKQLDLVALKVVEPNNMVAPIVDFGLYSGQEYFVLGGTTQAQDDVASVRHGKVAATRPDAWDHVRGDTLPGAGDPGGGVFSLSSGMLIGVCVGADTIAQQAVFAPMAQVRSFLRLLPAAGS